MILWLNTSGQQAGEVATWSLADGYTATANGTPVAPTYTPFQYLDPTAGWRAAAIGDLNGDGKSDIIWQNTAGDVWTWLMNGSHMQTGGGIGALTEDWHISGVGKVAGSSEIFFQSDAGDVGFWKMDASGLSVADYGFLNDVAGGGTKSHAYGTEKLIEVADFDGDGSADLAFQTATGIDIWTHLDLVNGTHVSNPVFDATYSDPNNANWHLV